MKAIDWLKSNGLKWLHRISFGIGLLFILFACISSDNTDYKILGFSLENGVNFFHIANSFFLITIVLILHDIKHKDE